VAGTAVGEVVAVYRSDNDVFQIKVTHHAGDVFDLLLLERQRTTRGDVTELATASADVSADEKGCSAITPALGAVRTECVFADGMAAFIIYHANDLNGFLAKR
jgi:hypothetical protein